MSAKGKPAIGSVTWTDLAVPDAAEIRTFYSQVVGWSASPHEMGQYHDFDTKTPEGGDIVTGTCHNTGPNTSHPPHWLIYILDEDVAESARRCQALGGQIVDGPRQMGDSRSCVIQDPVGAVAALVSQ